MYEMDPFDSCPKVTGNLETSAPYYCVLSVHIDHPKENADLFDYIQKISAKKLHYKHDRLKRGVCVKTCLDNHDKMENPRRYQNDDAPLQGQDAVSSLMNAYNKVLNICVNKKLYDQHRFLARTSIDYCVGENMLKTANHTDLRVENIFQIAFALIVLLLVASFTYDSLIQKPAVINFFDRFKRTRRLLEVFSVKRNWEKLVENKSSDLADFSSLHASKLLIMFLFVLAHVYRVIVSMPFENPNDVEKVSL